MAERSIGLRFSEAAEILGVSRQSVYLAVRTLAIQCIQGSPWLEIPLEEFERLVVCGGFLGRQPKKKKAIARRSEKQAALLRAMEWVIPYLRQAVTDTDTEARTAAFREIGARLREVREAA